MKTGDDFGIQQGQISQIAFGHLGSSSFSVNDRCASIGSHSPHWSNAFVEALSMVDEFISSPAWVQIPSQDGRWFRNWNAIAIAMLEGSSRFCKDTHGLNADSYRVYIPACDIPQC